MHELSQRKLSDPFDNAPQKLDGYVLSSAGLLEGTLFFHADKFIFEPHLEAGNIAEELRDECVVNLPSTSILNCRVLSQDEATQLPVHSISDKAEGPMAYLEVRAAVPHQDGLSFARTFVFVVNERRYSSSDSVMS